MSKGQHGRVERVSIHFNQLKTGSEVWKCGEVKGEYQQFHRKRSTSPAVQTGVSSTSNQKKLCLNSQQRISLSPDQLCRVLATPCVLSNHQVFTLHPWPPFPLPPPFWMRFSTLSLPVASALCYFPTPCKWHWPAGVNSHSAEEMSQRFGVPNSDGSSITKAANTHYAPITGHHSPNCNSIQSCRKAQSRMSGPKSAEANLRGWAIGKSNIARQQMR